MASSKAALVGGSLGPLACLVVNSLQRISAILELGDLGSYNNWHTYLSSILIMYYDGKTDCPMLANALTTSSSVFCNAVQQLGSPLKANFPVWSAPVNAWKPSSAADIIGPSEV